MNELEIIRSQLAGGAIPCGGGRQRVRGSVRIDGALRVDSEATRSFREACVELSRLGARAIRGARSDAVGAARRATSASRRPARLPAHVNSRASRPHWHQPRGALAAGGRARRRRLADAARAAWQEFARFFNSGMGVRGAPRSSRRWRSISASRDLRAVCAIDADSILDERHRYARVDRAAASRHRAARRVGCRGRHERRQRRRRPPRHRARGRRREPLRLRQAAGAHRRSPAPEPHRRTRRRGRGPGARRRARGRAAELAPLLRHSAGSRWSSIGTGARDWRARSAPASPACRPPAPA